MRITAIHCMNFKRLHEVEIHPEADRAIILIGGRNANGKSSLLDALTTAFGGKRSQPADPIRHGADEATIRVELDGGALEVSRVIRSDGESLLEVRDKLGAVKSPQTMLDKLVGARFLDPLAFLSLPSKEQRAQLMRVIPDSERITTLDEKRARAFDRRTEIGRDLTRAQAELDRLPEVEVGTPIDVAALSAERAAMADQQRAGDGLGAEVSKLIDLVTRDGTQAAALQQRIERLERELDAVRREAATLETTTAAHKAELATAQEALQLAGQRWAELAPRREQLDADLARANAHNQAVYAAEAQAKRRAEVAGEVERLGAERKQITELLETIDERKAKILAAAKLPVEGLAISDDGIMLGGVPLAQASDAERWRVALAIAVAASPGLSDVWIRDGALLDDESLALVAEHAAAAGKRVWIERVGTADPGVIEIRDGRVRAAAGEAA